MKRRDFLRAAGVTIALPIFESAHRSLAAEAETPVRRMVCIGNEFGMYPGAFWPTAPGREYESTPLLKPLDGIRQELTLFSHLDHGLKGGHFAVHTFLTGVKSAEAKSMPDGGISLDQRAAEFVGAKTRFPSLTIGSDNGLHGGTQMCWTRTGTRVPPISGPRELFRELFASDDREAKQQVTSQIGLQESILDSVLGDAKSLERRLNKTDQRKLEEYLSSVRDVEQKLELRRQWQAIPKPKPAIGEPRNRSLTHDLPLLYDLIALALQTDSTRVATLEIGNGFSASDLGIRKGYHGLSHHGKVQAAIDDLVKIELYQIEQFARFLGKLRELRSGSGVALLDETMVLLGSGMGNANSHTNSDLPVILAGGGFRHGEHKIYPSDGNKRVPLSNLYLSMLQQFGLETEAFSKSNGTLTGLATA
jgi:hypothetical protein